MKGENEHIEEIEDLIRNESGQEVFTIQDGDWEQLQMMMNADNRQKKLGWIWRVSIELLLFFAWLMMANSDFKVDDGLAESNNSTPSVIEIKGGEEESANLSLEVKREVEIIEMGKTNNQQALRVENEVVYNFGKANGLKFTEKAANTSQRLTGTKVSAFGLSNNEMIQLKVAEGKADNLSLNGEGVNEGGIVNVGLADPLVQDSLLAEVKLLTEDVDSTPLITDSVDSNPIEEKTVNPKMHLYFGVGTEWSLTSRSPVGATKLKLQLGAEYQFKNRWSVLSGLNYSVKDYQTKAENYVVNQGFWTGGIKPSTILAKCNVLEVPLNIRYYFTPQDRKNSSFYLMAGASSYLMASERYSFTYNVEDPSLKQDWNGKWKNMHYLSVLNLSAGYQKNLQGNWSVLFEPYVHLPLTGIGFGQVDLVSFGMSVQLKY